MADRTPRILGVFAVLVVLALVVGALLWSGALSSSSDPNTVVIGGVLPLTGDAGTFGENASRGAQLAVQHANDQRLGGDVQFAFRAEDSRGDASQAVAAALKLLDSNHATLLIGDVTSAGTHALIPITKRRKVPLGSPAASDPALSGASEYFFRVWPSDDYEARVIGDYAISKGFDRIAIVYSNTDYGVAMVRQMIEVVGKNRVVLDVPVERETPNFRPVVERVSRSNAQALFLVLYPEDAKRMLQQLAELNVSLPILATATFEDPTLLSVPNAERVVFASPKPPSEDAPQRGRFTEAYQASFHAQPGVLSDTGYDAAMLLMKAYAETGGKDPLAVVNYIRSLKDYPGVSGLLSFDANGDVKKEYGLKTIRDGAFVWAE